MGVIETVGADRFPRQSEYVGQPVRVCFDYDTSREFAGLVLRDDRDAPHEMLILLHDGRVVRDVECQWSPWGGLVPAGMKRLVPFMKVLAALREVSE